MPSLCICLERMTVFELFKFLGGLQFGLVPNSILVFFIGNTTTYSTLRSVIVTSFIELSCLTFSVHLSCAVFQSI